MEFQHPSIGEQNLKLDSHRAQVEAVINSLAVEGSARFTKLPESDEGLMWIFKYGTVRVFVVLSGESSEDTLTIWAPVLRLPVTPGKEQELFEHLLTTNWLETWESRFALRGTEVVLHTIRTVDALDPSEISRAITIVATLADEYDEPLIERFGGSSP